MVDVSGCAEHWNWVGEAPIADWPGAAEELIRAASLLPASEDGLAWSEEACALMGPLTGTGRRVRPGIRIGSLTLTLLDEHDELLKTLPLAGRPLAQARQWLSDEGAAPPGGDQGTLGTPSSAALSDIERWFGNAAAVLGVVSRRTRGASLVSTSVATLQTTVLIELPSREGESERAIRLAFDLCRGGLEAQFCVTSTPEGPGSRLSLGEIIALRDGDAQAKAVERFVIEALQQAYRALQREWRPR